MVKYRTARRQDAGITRSRGGTGEPGSGYQGERREEKEEQSTDEHEGPGNLQTSHLAGSSGILPVRVIEPAHYSWIIRRLQLKLIRCFS
jgi:hypothetical protein